MTRYLGMGAELAYAITRATPGGAPLAETELCRRFVPPVDVAVEWTHADTGTRQQHIVKSVSLDRVRGEIVLMHSTPWQQLPEP